MKYKRKHKSDDKIHVLIIYDVANDKQRTKLAHMLQGYGSRIQKSAFEAYMYERVYNKMLKLVQNYIGEDDNLRIYKLFDGSPIINCGKKVDIFDADIVVI